MYLALNSDKILYNYLDFFDVAKKNLVVTDNFIMSSFLKKKDLPFKKDYKKLFNKLFYGMIFNYSILDTNTITKDLNIMKDCFFVVKDLNLLIDNIKKKGYV